MRKGISEVVGLVLLIFMVVVVSSSFYYWYSAGQTDAQIKTELFQADVFDQVVSRTSAIIDAFYDTNREVNINNFAEYTTRLCADEKSIPMDASDIRLELYEGYGSDTDIVCAVSGFDGGCNTNETTLFGVLGGKNKTNGVYIIKSTDGSSWTTSAVNSVYNDYTKFNFTHLDTFIEGNNKSIDPENMILLGVGTHKSTGNRKSVLVIMGKDLSGKSYNITDLDENITVYYDAEMAQESPGEPHRLYRGGAFVDSLTEVPLRAILTKQFAVYDTPERLADFGNTRSVDNAKTTAIQRIVRLNMTQLLVGVTATLSGTAFIDETQDLSTGAELNYPTVPVCPYDVVSFATCGVTIDPAVCEITIDGVPVMAHVPEFANSSKTNSAPVFIAVNNLTTESSKVPAILYTGYIQDSSTIFCIDLVGADPSYEIVEMKYHSTSNRVLVFLKNSIQPAGTQIMGVRDTLGTYTAALISPPTPSKSNPETFDFLDNSIYVGGSDLTNATIERLDFNNASISNISIVYSNSSKYSTVQKLLSYTVCTDRKPYCLKGCNKALKKGDCTDLTLSIEDSSCDLSSFAPETTFTVRLGIGQFFQNLEIFTKKTGVSTEINATEFN